MNWALRFLGVGNSQSAMVLGSAAAVLERSGAPELMIDCGQEALTAFQQHYQAMPGRCSAPLADQTPSQTAPCATLPAALPLLRTTRQRIRETP
jgi:hypothetical protein